MRVQELQLIYDLEIISLVFTFLCTSDNVVHFSNASELMHNSTGYVINNWFMLLAVHYRVMEHLGSLESTQEAIVVLGYRLGQPLHFFRALQTSRVLHNSIVHAKA